MTNLDSLKETELQKNSNIHFISVHLYPALIIPPRIFLIVLTLVSEFVLTKHISAESDISPRQLLRESKDVTSGSNINVASFLLILLAFSWLSCYLRRC